MAEPTPEIITGRPYQHAGDGQLVPVEPPSPIDPLAIVQQAVEKGIAVSELAGLVEMARQMQKDRAAEAFAVAVSSFQAEVPTVFKRRSAEIKKDGQKLYGYRFASFDDVMREAGPVLAKHRIAINFSTEQAGPQLKVTCRIRVGTHTEDHTLTVPIPAMSVNDTQRYGAALAYAKRYALCAALNIVVTDEDDDAEALVDTITEEQVKELTDLAKRKGVNWQKFLQWAQVDDLKKLPLGSLAKTRDMLSRKPDVQRMEK